jgi:mono/diheme cytochrome c family protein
MLRTAAFIAVLAAAFSVLAADRIAAEEKPVPLKDGPGRETVENNCAACHSLDYIRINAPFPDRKLWEAEVAKMINAFGATIDPPDAKTIVDYLARAYGRGD